MEWKMKTVRKIYIIFENDTQAAKTAEYPLIPMSEIRDEPRKISIAWHESATNWIGDKVKLASDIQNYADWYARQQTAPLEQKIRELEEKRNQLYADVESLCMQVEELEGNGRWIPVEEELPNNEFWHRVLINGSHHILPHCLINGEWWCYGESHPTDLKVSHWQQFYNLPTPPGERNGK